MKKLIILLTILTLCGLNNLIAQCSYQVTHTEGAMVVNGVNVTVTSSGLVDTLPFYCTNTTPYLIGYDSLSGSGAYTFNFSPAVSSLSLNFSGISNLVASDSEIVMLYVNGLHYAIPSVGTYNSCDSIAVLTASGDICGCANCGVSGWNGTTISGVITSISVYDTALVGSGGGSLFSLFICDPINSVPDLSNESTTVIYPNPFSSQTTIVFNQELKNTTIKIIDILGKEIKTMNFSGNQIIIDKEEMRGGMYFFQVIDEMKIVVNKIIIVEE